MTPLHPRGNVPARHSCEWRSIAETHITHLEEVRAQMVARCADAVAAARAEWEASEPTCSCCWVGRHETNGDAVPFLQPCAGQLVYGDWRVKQARAEWEADHEKNGGCTYFNEMVRLQRKCVALGTDVETYKRLALENGAARDHAIKEWHLSQDRAAEKKEGRSPK